MRKQVVNTSISSTGKVDRNRNMLSQALYLFSGKDVTITIQHKRKIRSNRQNAYLWGCVYPILAECFKDHWGDIYTLNQIHHFCKMKFNCVERINESTGEVIYIEKSTTENDTFDQEQYHEKIRQFAYEWFNTTIPLPNEQLNLL